MQYLNARLMEACFKAANEIYADLFEKNPDFKKTIDSMIAFRNDQYSWWRVAEYGFGNFMVRAIR